MSLDNLKKMAIAIVAAGVLVGLIGVTPALASSPVWTITSIAAPTNLPPGSTSAVDDDQIILRIENVSATTAEGATLPILVEDQLPAGVSATRIESQAEREFVDEERNFPCTLIPLRCTISEKIAPYEAIQIEIHVNVAADAQSGGLNLGKISGGGSLAASVSQPVTISATPVKFGIEHADLIAMNEDGSLDTQAGSHPYQVTSIINLNHEIGPHITLGASGPPSEKVQVESVAPVKDISFELPPGFIGNPTVISQCSEQDFSRPTNTCPESTVIGVSDIGFGYAGSKNYVSPLYNLTPRVGEPLRMGFQIKGVHIYLDTAVHTGGDYGVTVTSKNISQIVGIDSAELSIWGSPDDPSHHQARGYNCLYQGMEFEPDGVTGPCGNPEYKVVHPFLRLPTSCAGPLKTTVLTDSWEEPGNFSSTELSSHEGSGRQLGLDGCNKLDFQPAISVVPDGPAGSTPSGLSVALRVPQEASLSQYGLGESDVKTTTVTLPEGVQISPAGADGLSSCATELVGLESPEESSCPESSKVGTVEITSPLLPNPLRGAAYLAEQNANPFGSLIALYVIAKDPVSGVLVKIPGQVTLNPVTGQLVSTFENTPQLPFEEFKLSFFGSDRAPLSTPPLCGSYTTDATMYPWSGNGPAAPSSQFQITSGPNGAPCSNPQPFTPEFQAGSTNLQAGAFTPFTLTMTRPDADQTLSRVEMQMPPGLLGTLSTVKLCGEPQASQGTCGEESLIGRTIVSAGLGGDPYTVRGGKVFVTTGYKGAPYGLSIVNPAVAGPFNLGTVVVRASIFVDPHSAALRIVSDPLPTILDGIPLQLQHVQVIVERPEGFTFNPTDCNKMSIVGTLSSTDGKTAQVTTPFQVTNCAKLAFQPKLTVSTAGKTSRTNGASLNVKLTYPEGPYDANISKVKVDLPKQLPSRLTTLQKACPAATFASNPAACPAASIVGHAKATTPVLPVPLEGPAYFVSHAGEEFPDLIIVLQGYGTTVDLVGSTYISKAGITSSTFKSVPDVPVGTFELKLPEGRYSALAANVNLCDATLKMPTAFVGQNGAEIHTSTPIAATGCAKHKKAKNKKTKKKSHALKSAG